MENELTQVAVESVLPKRTRGRPTKEALAAREVMEKQLVERTKGPVARAMVNQLVNKLLFTPERVAAILQKFYERALESDTVLLKYVEKILPREAAGGLTIVVKTPVLGLMNRKADIAGQVMDAEVVEDSASKVSAQTDRGA